MTDLALPGLLRCRLPHRGSLSAGCLTTATGAQDKDNGAKFPEAFAEALAADGSGTDRDGVLSLTDVLSDTPGLRWTSTSAGESLTAVLRHRLSTT